MPKRTGATWLEFRQRFNAEYINPRLTTNKQTAEGVNISLNHFERICQPGSLADIDAKTFNDFIAGRRKQGVTDSTVGKDLDHLRLSLNHAQRWGYFAECPAVPRLEEGETRPARYIPPDDFMAIFDACQHAVLPVKRDHAHRPGDWWRSLMLMAIATGFFVKELLALKWDHDVDLDAGTATLAPKATSLRRRRTKTARLPPIAVEYLRKLPRASVRVFGWADDKRQLDLPAMWLNDDRAGLWSRFRDIQARAGINLTCDRDHRHTESCSAYGFDDLRNSSEPYCRAEILARVEAARRPKGKKG